MNTKKNKNFKKSSSKSNPVQREASSRPPRARRMTVREIGRDARIQARQLRERRTDLSDIEPVRLQKALADSGEGSRRSMEEEIAAGRITVNGKVAVLGDKITPADRVERGGRPVRIKWADRLPRVMIYYKPEGEIVTRRDPQGRTNIFDRLPPVPGGRWIAVGRLDINTSGLVVLTTSGELANRFAHPSFEMEREYSVRVLGGLSDEEKQSLLAGVMLDDGEAKIERMTEQGGDGANKWYNVVIREGRNREVRRLFEAVGKTVSRLVRIRFGEIAMPSRLKRGQFYELNEMEVAYLLRTAGLKLPA